MASGARGSGIRCHHCHELGHIRRFCPQRPSRPAVGAPRPRLFLTPYFTFPRASGFDRIVYSQGYVCTRTDDGYWPRQRDVLEQAVALTGAADGTVLGLPVEVTADAALGDPHLADWGADV